MSQTADSIDFLDFEGKKNGATETYAMLRCVRPGGILSISLNALELGRPYPFTLHLEQARTAALKVGFGIALVV